MLRQRPTESAVLWAQSAYFFITGLWPLLHYRSFEVITGRKRDIWLVKTVGALLLPVAASIGVAASRRRASDEVRLLAAGSALALGGVEALYALRGRIRWVYLIDAAIEALLVLGLLTARRPAEDGT